MTKYTAGILFFIVFFCSCATNKKATKAVPPPPSTSGNILNLSPKAKEQKELTDFFDAENARLTGNTKQSLTLYNEYLKQYKNNPTAYYNTARLQFQQKNVTEAIKNAQRATELNPDNKFFQEYYVQLLVYNNDIKLAEEQYNKLISKNPNNDEYLYRKAMLFVKSKDYDKAIETLNDLEKKTGFNEDIILQKKAIYQRSGKTDEAVAELKKLKEADPSTVEYAIMMIDLYESENKKEKADTLYRDLEKNYPNDPGAQVALAQYYLGKNNTAEYNNYMQKIVRNRNLDIDTKISLILPLIQKLDADTNKDISMVTSMVKSISDDAPESSEARELYANVLYYTKQYDQALAEYKKILSKDASKFDTWSNIISVHFEKMQYDSVIQYATQCADNFPNNPMPFFFKGVALSQKKETDNAIKSLNKAIDLDPENPVLSAQIYSALGEAYHAQKKYELSDSCFNTALKYQPDDATTLNNYAYYLSVRKTKLEEAEIMSKKTLTMQPNSKSFLDTYGWILFQQGKYKEAKDYIEKAIKSGGQDDGTLYEHLGDIYYKMNDSTKAIENWKLATQKGEDNPTLNKKITEGKWYEE